MLGGVIFALVARSRVLDGQWLLPVWPLVAICLGSLLERGVRLTFETIKIEAGKLAQILGIQTSAAVRQGLGSLVSVLTVFAFFFTPLIWIVVLDSRGFLANDRGVFENGVYTPPYQGAYLPGSRSRSCRQCSMPRSNTHRSGHWPGYVTWMLTSRAVDVRNVALYELGGAQTNMPGFDPARFVYPQALDGAKYAVVDNSWRGWANSDPPNQRSA